MTTVDFVAKSVSPNEWRMVLVEEGPWHGPIEDQLRRIQGRLYDCIDIALDGKLAEKFPEAGGKKIVIRLDCYNVPKAEVEMFFRSFSDNVFSTADYKEALAQNRYVSGITFEVNFDSIH